MTQKQKELLLKDLCARLPYGVWIERKLKNCKFGAKCMVRAHDIDAIERGQYDFYKPYLFPCSSMTEEQRLEYESLCIKETSECGDLTGFFFTKDYYYDTVESIDYLYKNHFDIRNLIPIGLAIDATGLNIY